MLGSIHAICEIRHISEHVKFRHQCYFQSDSFFHPICHNSGHIYVPLFGPILFQMIPTYFNLRYDVNV